MIETPEMISETVDTKIKKALDEERAGNTTHENVLDRAVAEGIKLTVNPSTGVIELPGTAKVKAPKAEKAPKVAKVPVVKPFKGITSKIASSGTDTLTEIIDGLTIIRDTMTENDITSAYKVSTYKDELRIAFADIKAGELLPMMTSDQLNEFNLLGYFVPEKKDIFALKIA